MSLHRILQPTKSTAKDLINVFYLRRDGYGWYLEATLTLQQVINFDALRDVLEGLKLPEGPDRWVLLERNRPIKPCSVDVLEPFLRVIHDARSTGMVAKLRFLVGSQDDILEAAVGLVTWMDLRLEVA